MDLEATSPRVAAGNVCYVRPCVGETQNTVFAVGKSIFNRTSATYVGELMLKYGGGGHHAAGTCQVSHDRAEAVREEIVRQINQDG